MVKSLHLFGKIKQNNSKKNEEVLLISMIKYEIVICKLLKIVVFYLQNVFVFKYVY